MILPSTLTFNTGAPEIMECVGGPLRVPARRQRRMDRRPAAGEKFSVPGDSSFQIRVAGEPYSYICHFG